MKVILPSLALKDYQENRQERGIYDKRNTLNDLTGKEWLFSKCGFFQWMDSDA